MKVPGAAAHHSIITENCQGIHGAMGAYDEAVARARAAYEAIVEGWADAGQQPRIHLIISVERPPREATDAAS